MGKVQYVGNRPYVEFPVNGTMIGFARGTIKELPADLCERFKGDNYPQWKVIVEESEVEKKTKQMAEAVEPVIEEPVVEEPVVEEPVVDVEKSEQMVEAIANDDSSSADSAFNESWTRNEMVKWMKARGQSVPRSATKAAITEMAHALLENAAGEQ